VKTERLTDESSRTLRTATWACVVAAALALAAAVALGRPAAGLAIAVGLLAGSLNGYMARRSAGSELSFRAASVARLLLLSGLCLGAGLLLGLDVAWLAILGLAAAQLLLAASAVRELVRR
jgi:hypothetical protein